MRKKIIKIVIGIFILLSCGCASLPRSNEVFQVSTIGALMQGVYQGAVPVSVLKEKGDFGIGTFEGLDGEMVIVNGKIYKVLVDGVASAAADSEQTPFAVTTFFKADKTTLITQEMSDVQLKRLCDQMQPSKNFVYAVKITGDFSLVKTRSVPKFTKPYPGLKDAVKQQRVFELSNVSGTLVGFYFPRYFDGVNVGSYHLHFISQDKKTGGHVLECIIRKGIIELGVCTNFHLALPSEGDFLSADLTKEDKAGLIKAESK